jgi:hypothetical protein
MADGYRGETVMWATLQTIYAIYFRLVEQGSIEPGSVSTLLRDVADQDARYFNACDPIEGADLLREIAATLDPKPPEPLAVIDGGKTD